jgi:hypothetical protein
VEVAGVAERFCQSRVMKSYTGPPATLGSTAAAGARIIVWCRDCRHQVEPDAAELVQRYGADTSVQDWHKRLICSHFGGREIDFVLTGRGGEGGIGGGVID